MKTRTLAQKTIRNAAALSCLFGLLAVGFIPQAASAGEAVAEQGKCAYSMQVRKSNLARRQYLSRLDQALNGKKSQNAVEQMYGSIKPASYQTGEESSFAAAENNNGIDTFSADCLGCHDGGAAVPVGLQLRNDPFNRTSHVSSKQNDHAIGMNYNTYVGADHGFKPLTNNRSMILINGKVGCLTCHNPLNPAKGHLVKADNNSDLCFSCHNK